MSKLLLDSEPFIESQVFNPYRLFVGGFIPNCLMRYQGISSTAKLCWARLAQYAGEDGKAFPSQETLAKEIGISERQCRTVLKLLETKGFVKRVVPEGRDKWLHKTTHYLFLFHPLFLTDSLRGKSTSLSERKSTSVGTKSKFPAHTPQKIRSFQEFREDRNSPLSTTAEEDFKRIVELGL